MATGFVYGCHLPVKIIERSSVFYVIEISYNETLQIFVSIILLLNSQAIVGFKGCVLSFTKYYATKLIFENKLSNDKF